MSKFEIVILLLRYISGGLAGAFGALCFIGREKNDKQMIKKYKPFFVFFILTALFLPIILRIIKFTFF